MVTASNGKLIREELRKRDDKVEKAVREAERRMERNGGKEKLRGSTLFSTA